jgi:CubicO group peptidase (beta-lactamase class C family)
MAKGYGRSDRPPWPFFETVTPAPAGAPSTTGADMGRFMLALLHGGAVGGARVLSEAGLARMMAPAITTPTGSMGLVFYETRYGGTRFRRAQRRDDEFL